MNKKKYRHTEITSCQYIYNNALMDALLADEDCHDKGSCRHGYNDHKRKIDSVMMKTMMMMMAFSWVNQGRSDPESRNIPEQYSVTIPKRIEGHDSDMEDTDKTCIPKFLRRISFKGRHMILGRSSNGSADEIGEEEACKADLEGGPPGQVTIQHILLQQGSGLSSDSYIMWVESETRNATQCGLCIISTGCLVEKGILHQINHSEPHPDRESSQIADCESLQLISVKGMENRKCVTEDDNEKKQRLSQQSRNDYKIQKI
ncbi:hypothetical protein Tco_0593728 [Tanacetum coccineum]